MRISKSIAVLLCSLATLALCVATADAQTRRGQPQGGQTRRAVPRPAGRRVATRPARVVYRRGYGYRPYYYGVYSPFFYGPHPYYGNYGYYGARYDQSSVRLEVKPEETEVYVDDYYAGVDDSYDGFFQRLHLPAGAHEIELHLDGYESTRESLYLVAGETYRIRHEMEPLANGAPQPARPVPPSDPEAGLYPAERGSPPALALPGAEQFGTLAVRVQPVDAEVLIDGELWQGFEGLDQLVVELGVGLHAVEVRRDGYRTYRTDVELLSGDTTLLNVSLPTEDEAGEAR